MEVDNKKTDAKAGLLKTGTLADRAPRVTNINDATEISIPALATTRNIWILGIFYFFAGVGTGTASAMTFISYIQWGLPTVWFSVSAVLSILGQTYTGIFVSYYGDRMKGKYGRRKPFIVVGFIISAIALVIGSIPPSHSAVVLCFWFIISQNLYYASFICLNLSLGSWLVESTSGPQDYASLFSISTNIGFFPGAIIALVLVALVGPIIPALIFAVGGAIAVYVLVTQFPSRVIAKAEKQPDIIPSFRLVIRTKEFRTLFVNRCLIYTGSSIGGSMTYVAGVIFWANTNKDLSSVLLIAVLAIVVIGLILNIITGKLVQTMDKLKFFKNVLLILAALGVVGFFTALTSSSYTIFLGYVIVMGAFFYPVMMIDTFFVRDLITADTFLTGLNRENLFQLAIDAPAGIVSTLFSSIPLIIVYASGFQVNSNASDDDDNTAQQYNWNDIVVWECIVALTFFASAIALAGYWSISRYPIDDYVAVQINKMVNLRTAKKTIIQNNQFGEGAAGDREFADEDDIDLDRLDPELSSEFGSIADATEYMFMLNFSALEVDAIVGGSDMDIESDGLFSACGAVPPLERIRRANLTGLVLGYITTLLVIIAILVQLIAQSTTLVVLFAVALIVTSLYTFYENSRRNAILRLLSLPQDTRANMAKMTSDKNHNYKQTIEDCIKRGTIPRRDGLTKEESPDPEMGQLIVAFANPIVDFEDVKLKGYKRIYLGLVVIGVLSIITIGIVA